MNSTPFILVLVFTDADNKLETTSRLVFSYRLDRGTGESPWSCSVCHFDAPSFEDFTKHLKSETHAYFVSISLLNLSITFFILIFTTLGCQLGVGQGRKQKQS